MTTTATHTDTQQTPPYCPTPASIIPHQDCSSLPSCQLVQLTHLCAYPIPIQISNPIPTYLRTSSEGERQTHLRTDSLPTKFALDAFLDDSIIAHPRIHIRNNIQAQSHPNEIEDLVDESPIHRSATCTHPLTPSHPSAIHELYIEHQQNIPAPHQNNRINRKEIK